jgi:hypothetical protein
VFPWQLFPLQNKEWGNGVYNHTSFHPFVLWRQTSCQQLTCTQPAKVFGENEKRERNQNGTNKIFVEKRKSFVSPTPKTILFVVFQLPQHQTRIQPTTQQQQQNGRQNRHQEGSARQEKQ